MNEISVKVKEWNHNYLAHHGLIRLISMDSLEHLKTPISWEVFIDMDINYFLENQDKPQKELEGE